MKREWTVLVEGWHLRSTQYGLELVGPERNISLEFQASNNNRRRIAAILSGYQMIPQSPSDKSVRETIQSLEAQGILRRQDDKPIDLHSDSKTEQLLWKLGSAFVGSQGPISVIYHLNPAESNLSKSSFHLVIAKYILHEGTKEEWARGADDDPSIAELKATMEALERWASGVIPEKELLKCSAQELGSKALDPQQIVAYSKWQYQQNGFQFTPFSPMREYLWKEVMTFPRGNLRYLPVECLYYPISQKIAPTPYTFASSSGVAAAFSFEDAVMGGIYEAIERDAFMLAWLNRLSFPRIENTTLPKKEHLRIRWFEEMGYKLHMVDLTLDLSPVILAIAVHKTEKPALVLGAASNFDVLVAMSKAIGEIEHQLYWQLRHPDRIRAIEDATQVRGVLDHLALYSSQKNLAKAEFLWKGASIPYHRFPFGNRKRELEKLLKLLESNGKEVIVADLTPPSLKKLGVWVIRSIPVGLVPISFGYGMEPLGMPRIREMSGKRKGWRGKPFTHPFA